MIIKERKYLGNAVKKGEKSRAIAEIYIDDAAELPAYDSNKDFDLVQGSVAYTVKSGELYVMGSDGKWYDTSGTIAKE